MVPALQISLRGFARDPFVSPCHIVLRRSTLPSVHFGGSNCFQLQVSLPFPSPEVGYSLTGDALVNCHDDGEEHVEVDGEGKGHGDGEHHGKADSEDNGDGCGKNHGKGNGEVDCE